jgi:hypothetical protein
MERKGMRDHYQKITLGMHVAFIYILLFDHSSTHGPIMTKAAF